MKFLILEGKHAEPGGMDGKVYRKGEIVESDVDLAAKFNAPHAIKFKRLPDEPVAVTNIAPEEG